MKRTLALLPLLALAAACSDQGTAPEPAAPTPAPVAQAAAGRYIVVLEDRGELEPSLARAAAEDLAKTSRVTPDHVFSHVLRGFAAELTAEQVAALRADPRVKYVEEDAPAQLNQLVLYVIQSPTPSWGIDRINQADLPLDNRFLYNATGNGVTAYVLDTGIRKTHADFGTRADYIANGAGGDFVGDGHGSAADCHGHGTHVAGTLGGSSYGVAKRVTVRAGRVVDCVGSGNSSMAIAAMDWIAAEGVHPAVVNMSLGYGDVQAVRDAATALVAAGFFVAAAAGNGNFAGTPQNACLQSPAGAPTVFTVGSTTSTDAESSFSNFGSCVDILAPGSSIVSAGIGSDVASGTRSGTSMATPHVAGVAAQYLQRNPTASPATTTSALKALGTPNTITRHGYSVLGGTPNLMLYTHY